MYDEESNIPVATLISGNNSQLSYNIVYAECVIPNINNENYDNEPLEVVVLSQQRQLNLLGYNIRYSKYSRTWIYITVKSCCLLTFYVSIFYFMFTTLFYTH